ncbi:DUF4229 domain-containing protein [Sinomonas atrocyanea]|uniref:DUF4229 domain-containing protein n=1 Tax=Sinomonas atrocyanea TaxID=37927 RepID=UPI003D99B648
MASLKYFLIRTVLFVVPFAVCMALGVGPIFSAVFAVLIAFGINYLFLYKQRDAAAAEVRDVFGGRKQARTKREVEDAAAEDAADEAQRARDAGPRANGHDAARSETTDRQRQRTDDGNDEQGPR